MSVSTKKSILLINVIFVDRISSPSAPLFSSIFKWIYFSSLDFKITSPDSCVNINYTIERDANLNEPSISIVECIGILIYR